MSKPDQPHRETPAAARRDPQAQAELEQLFDRIAAGTIEEVDELSPQDLDLLRSYYGDGDALQDVLDRLRGEADRS